jgi:hypothetical protein
MRARGHFSSDPLGMATEGRKSEPRLLSRVLRRTPKGPSWRRYSWLGRCSAASTEASGSFWFTTRTATRWSTSRASQRRRLIAWGIATLVPEHALLVYMYVRKEADRRHARGARQPGLRERGGSCPANRRHFLARRRSVLGQVLVDLLLDQGDMNRDSIFWHSFGRQPPHQRAMRFGDVDDVAVGIINPKPRCPKEAGAAGAQSGRRRTFSGGRRSRRSQASRKYSPSCPVPALRATRCCRRSTSRHRSPARSIIRACTQRRCPDGPVSLPSRLRVLVARNVDFSSNVMYSSRNGKWSGFECRGADRIGNLGAVAATAGGAR